MENKEDKKEKKRKTKAGQKWWTKEVHKNDRERKNPLFADEERTQNGEQR
jgi:hypothetical protein